MTTIEEQLTKKIILNADKIAKLREEIEQFHSSATSEEKAVYLAKKIYETIDESLPNFSFDDKKAIRMHLVKHKLTKNQSISAHDIVEQSVDVVQLEEIKEAITVWMIEQLHVTPETAEQFLKKLSINENQESSLNIEHVSLRKKQIRYFLIPSVLAMAASIIFVSGFNEKSTDDIAVIQSEPIVVEDQAIEYPHNDLPSYLQYQEINRDKLKDWLNGRNSLLADEPYFSTILQVAAEFNIHPILMFAITGQEQGFVSRDHPRAEEIANNPFNVFHSWQDFNTNILQSSQIAARTIVNLSKERPEDADPIQWINRKYAEDENWWKGVSALFVQIEKEVTEQVS